MNITQCCNSAMAILSFVAPHFCCSSVSSSTLRFSYFCTGISCLKSIPKRNRHIVYCSVRSAPVVEVSCPSVLKEGAGDDSVDFCVATFYKFVPIEDPEREVAKHHAFLQGRDIHGRIYMNEQGINAQYSGPNEDVLAYADWLKEDPRFSDILFQTSPSLYGHAFPRLKLRYKCSLLQLEGGMSHLPVQDPTIRATPLSPADWRNRLQVSSCREPPDEVNVLNCNRRSLLLDVRNGYEWDVGHFQGAERPHVDSFRYTNVGLSSHETAVFDPLAGVDKENTDILMYCTGGIRCDVYSTILRQSGFQNLYTLNGGISHYLATEGAVGWVGNLFVFDSRLSLPPSTYNSRLDTPTLPEGKRFVKCYICASKWLEFRHRNCANLDCNKLFLSCGSCVEEFRGCCCLECTKACRLRPVLSGHERYQKWHRYRDGNF